MFIRPVLLRPFNIIFSSCFDINALCSASKVHRRNKMDATKDVRQAEIFYPSHPDTEGPIENKIALVNGGTDKIGFGCAKELLQSGVRGVMIADTNEGAGKKRVATLSEEFGRHRVAFIQINPAKYTLLRNAFVSTRRHFRGLDIVINNLRFKETNWEDSVDQNIKSMVLSTELSVEFMGRRNGNNGGVVLNIASDFDRNTDCGPVCQACQDFIVRFDCLMAKNLYNSSDVKVLTICRATLNNINDDLTTVISKGTNGCVWMPE